MTEAAAMVGNSSSGIIEAASFCLPVVNVGNRQAGRMGGQNVIHVACERDAIVRGINQALSPAFRPGLAKMTNPYGDGKAAERMVQHLLQMQPEKLLHKHFFDLGSLSVRA
jgi:UDP-N-acetylglucosamine 2-epimerase